MCETKKINHFILMSHKKNVLLKFLTTAPILKFYSMSEPITVSCDSGKTGLGAVMLQGGRPVAYASRALTDTEQAYAQIEKEMLAIVFTCSKFHKLLFGRKDVTLETDYLPLLRIFEKKTHYILFQWDYRKCCWKFSHTLSN